jgi:inositol-hexakisphosphate/diphosphoinositol-pentakisphosphate 1-kinase
MAKKMKSRPMTRILDWLAKSPEFSILRFNNDMLLNQPIEEWIKCDILIGFYSFGFPLDKAIAYVSKFQPKMINDLTMQSLLWDRPGVLQRLRELGIPVAKSYVVLRGEDKMRSENSEPTSQAQIE